MNINLYKFTKKENSTKQPSGTGTQFACYLKEPTSVIEPVIVIETTSNTFPDYNYAYIATFGRYYYITDIISDGNLWQISMKTDVLATYKSNITSATLYLLRCSEGYDGSIIDNYYPVKTSYTTHVEYGTSPWIHESNVNNIKVSTGSFILGIVARPGLNDNGMYGSIKYVAMKKSEFMELVNALLDDSLYDFNDSNMSLELQKAIVDPMSFIKSCVWIPDLYSTLSGFATTAASDLDIWTWTITGCENKSMLGEYPYRTYNPTINITSHPAASTRGSYMNCEPYTRLALRMPPFGVFELDTTMLKSSAYVRAQIVMDYTNGLGIMELYNDSNICFMRQNAQVGVPIQLSQVAHDYINGTVNTGKSILSGLQDLLTGQLFGAASNALSAVGSAAEIMKPISSSVGSNGSFGGLYGLPALYHTFYDPVSEDLSHFGRPVCKDVTLSTLSSGAYVLCKNGDVGIPGTAGEQEQIRLYLETGAFLE